MDIQALNNPIPSDWSQYVTQSPVSLEVIPDQLWSTALYTSATTTQLTFFNTTGPDLSFTNMTQPGFLPNPQSFLIQAPRLYFRSVFRTDLTGGVGTPTSAYEDIIALLNTGRMVLTIGTKTYGPWRLWTMPAASFAKGVVGAAGAAAANTVSNYAQVDGPLWGMFPHLMISPLQNFQVDMFWPAAVTLTGNLNIEVLFDGQRARAVQ
jgi:hypothetical protein